MLGEPLGVELGDQLGVELGDSLMTLQIASMLFGCVSVKVPTFCALNIASGAFVR